MEEKNTINEELGIPTNEVVTEETVKELSGNRGGED